MGMKLIGQDCAVQITDGGVQDGTFTSTSSTSIKALARSIRISESLNTIETTCLGDTRKKRRGATGESKIELELAIDTQPLTNVTLGNYLKVEYKASSSLTSFTSWTGIVSENTIESPDGLATQKISIDCDAD